MAIKNVYDKTNVKVMNHHHDFYWERERYENPTCEFVKQCLDKYFPFAGENVSHNVINHIAKKELKERKNIDSNVVPNVFDYNAKPWVKDEYNSDLRKKFGIKDNDIVILQATRIAHRKAIEMAIDICAKLYENKNNLIGKTLYNGETFDNDSEIYFVLAGMNELEPDRYKLLIEKLENYGIKYKLINDYVGHSRSIENNEKIYSLWDIYVMSDFITYPSILEGWGNQFLEGIFAKLPQMVYEYPVFGTDIKQYGFDVVSLGDSYLRDENDLFKVTEDIYNRCTCEIIEILTSKEKYKSIVNKNFEIAQKELSYEKLLDIIYKIF